MQKTNLPSRVESVVENGHTGHSCSEAILVAYGPDFGLDKSIAMRLSSGLAGGIGHSKGTCGAVSAACLVLGLARGPQCLDHATERKESIRLCSEFVKAFTSVHDSVLCADLCFRDLPENAEATMLRESGIPEKLIRSAAMLIEKLLRA